MQTMRENTKANLILVIMIMSGSLFALEPVQTSPTKAIKSSDTSVIDNDRVFDGTWKFGLSSGRVSEVISQSTASSAYASANVTYNLHSDFVLHFEPSVSFNVGQAQSLYGDFEPRNGLGISEASSEWKPAWFFDLSAGILNQRRIDNQLLLKNTAFPGIFARVKLMDYEQISTLLETEAAIPTSYSLDSEAGELEKTPTFYAQTLRMILKQWTTVKTQLWITHFSFHDLPSVVAQKSNIKGNTVTNGYDFDYGFEGLSAGIDGEVNAYQDILQIRFGARYLKNNKAPDHLNNGRIYETSLRWSVLDSLDIVPGITWFENRPDASVAYYNSSAFGNSNRQGYVYACGLDFTQLKFSLKGKYIDSYLIYKDPYQTRRKTIELILETLDVHF